ncbi:hypothetical protein GPECTOR_55g296 [Gonium pectorale]|uniref:Uncharacterized protein n=1 Tax=Gonium pectorale TaxID=33097 RepID=A0A150G7R8_GONPE|nr:hypothetical protein GPECTOR_55g296 [Gonium pectorale]|eukprot:KXZ45390.1 hypothetical protein GPECTOR_55g296 [Gonium pectorale]
MTFLALLLLALLPVSNYIARAEAQLGGCPRPLLNTSVFQDVRNNGGCILLEKVCVDDGMLVLFDEADRAENLTRRNPLGELWQQSGLWNFPARGGANSDALVGHQPNSYVPIRPASRLEGSPHLRSPVFSPCVLPVVMITDWPYNMGEVMAQLAPIADVYFRQKGMIDDLATLVLATPNGLGMTPFQHVLLQPYSRHPSMSLAELSAGRGAGEGGGGEAGRHPSCFERVVLCKMHGFPQGIRPTVQTLLAHLAARGRIPADPLGFGPPPPAPPLSLHNDSTLRVLIEARSGPTRNIRNMHDLIAACEAANAAGFRAGSFTRLSCKVLNTADTPQLHGNERFYATVGAVRSAHVLVTLHGAGAANCFFLEEDNGGTALLEIRPCRFGTQFCGWPDAYMQSQLSRAGDVIRFFALNVEDPAQCAPSDYEAAAQASPADTPMRGGDDMRARDQHVSPRPATLLAMLRHVGGLLRDDAAFRAAQREGKLHGYAVPGGLALGPLCVKDVAGHVRGGATVLQ